MFYLYHIKGIKWGCTKNLQQRLKRQGYTISDLADLITIDNVNKAADMEKELNIKDGYGWNTSQDYRVLNKICKAGGVKSSQSPNFVERCKKAGKANKQATNTLMQYRDKGTEASLKSEKHNSKQSYTCPHCNKIGYGLNMLRWHMDNCKLKVSS
jgi:hypothetical protein